MPVKYEIRAITGKYTDRDGNEKNSYATLGKVIQTKKGGFMLKIDTVPVTWDGWAYLEPPRPKEEKPAPASSRPTDGGLSDMDDDIPF